jgi:hypothetical protein
MPSKQEQPSTFVSLLNNRWYQMCYSLYIKQVGRSTLGYSQTRFTIFLTSNSKAAPEQYEYRTISTLYAHASRDAGTL